MLLPCPAACGYVLMLAFLRVLPPSVTLVHLLNSFSLVLYSYFHFNDHTICLNIYVGHYIRREVVA